MLVYWWILRLSISLGFNIDVFQDIVLYPSCGAGQILNISFIMVSQLQTRLVTMINKKIIMNNTTYSLPGILNIWSPPLTMLWCSSHGFRFVGTFNSCIFVLVNKVIKTPCTLLKYKCERNKVSTTKMLSLFRHFSLWILSLCFLVTMKF